MMSDRIGKVEPVDKDISSARTDLYETVEKNAKEHGYSMGEYLDLLLKRHITPSEFFKDLKWPDRNDVIYKV